MSSLDFFNDRFPIKTKRITKNYYTISEEYYKSTNNKFNIINKYLFSFDSNIINIIKKYYLPRKNKLLVIDENNVNNITSIDDDITAISCFNLNLKNLPDYIYKANNLISLNCSFNNIEHFDDSTLFENLLMFNCNFNKITQLPNNLYKLKELYVNYNMLSYLPALPNIYFISCINNDILYIDTNLYPYLKYFYSYWNSKSLDTISKKINCIN